MRVLRTWPKVLFLMLVVTPQSNAGEPKLITLADNEVEQLEARRMQAMIHVDTAFLNEVLSDDLTYTHSNGAVQTKAEFIGSLEEGGFDYLSISREDVKTRVYGTAAVATGIVKMEVKVDGKAMAGTLRYTDVYAKAGGAWRLVAWQSTLIPEGS